MNKHNGEKPFKCDLCDYATGNVTIWYYPYGPYDMSHALDFHSMVQKGQNVGHINSLFLEHQSCLRQHKLRHEKNFKCDQCDYKTINKKILENHVRQNHTTERPFKCDQCDFAGASKAALHHHSRTHNDRNFICSICSKGFNSKGKCCSWRYVVVLGNA